jgi:hypothetical protein
MKQIIVAYVLALSVCCSLRAQNSPIFPGRLANQSDLLVAANFAHTKLTAQANPGDTTITVINTGTFAPLGAGTATALVIDSEVIRVCAKTATTFTVCSDGNGGRGFDGTIGATHRIRADVWGYLIADHINRLAAEVISLEANRVSPGSNQRTTKGGVVVVYPPNNATACITGQLSCTTVPLAPDGTLISTVGTTTAGLTEALNYAAAHGYDMHIMGGDDLFISQGGNCTAGNPPPQGGPGPTCNAIFLNLHSTWQWPALQGLKISCGAIQLGSNGNFPTIAMDSLENVEVDCGAMQIDGIVSTAGRGVVEVIPTSRTPLDNGVSVGPSIVKFGGIVGSGSTDILLRFVTDAGSIVNSVWQINELNGGNYGLTVNLASSGGNHGFKNNEFHIQQLHAARNTGIQVGNSAALGLAQLGSCPTGGNIWAFGWSDDNSGLGRALDTSACGDIYNIYSTSHNVQPTVVFSPNSSGNQITVGGINGPTGVASTDLPIDDISFFHNNSITWQPILHTVSAVTVGASPFTSPSVGDIAGGALTRRRLESVTGGAVSAIGIGAVTAVGVISGVSGSPMQVTTTINVPTNTFVLVQGVGGCTAANGYWQVTNVNATHFTLNGAGGCNSAYTSGGGVSVITYVATGGTGGSFDLEPGAFLQVTYTSTPTMMRSDIGGGGGGTGSGTPGGVNTDFQINNSGAFGPAPMKANADGSMNASKGLTWADANKPTFNAGGTTTCDFSQSNLCEVDFGAGNTTLAFTNAHGSGPYWLRSCQDAVGGRSYTFPATVKGAAQPDAAAGVTNCTEQPFTFDGTNLQGGAASVPSSLWHGFGCPEGPAPGGVIAFDILYCDSTANRFKMINNNGTAAQVVASGVDINTSDQVTATHLAAALPVAQGGLGAARFADFHYLPAANCVNAVAGSAWSTGATPAALCRAGTNNLEGLLSPWGASDTAQTSIHLPKDWDSATNPSVSLDLTSTDTTSGHTIIMQLATACAKGDGSTTDDVAFNAAQSFSTITLNTTNHQTWTATLSSITMTGCTAPGTLRLQLSRTTDTATNVGVVGMSITIPRILVMQAN